MRRYLAFTGLICLCLSTLGLADVNHQLWWEGGGGDLGMIAYFVDKLPGTELTGDLVPDIDTVLPDPFYNFPEYNDNTHSANFRAGNLPPDNDPAYSAHLWGWVTIPETGDYTWHVTSDDNSSVYIADTMDEIIANYGGTILENPTMVCSVDGWSGFTAWNGNAPGTNGNTATPTRGKQTSEVFTYNAGQVLAFYVTHDEGTLGDHLNVAWTPPGGNAPDNASLSEALTNIPPALERAFGANPASGTTDLPYYEETLSWSPGVTANTHNVYFSNSFADVNDRSPTALIADGITETSLDISTDLETTYYWAVDEVNSAPDFTVYEGKIWSFTVEPEFLPIENVTATASSSFGVSGPEKTVDGSGLSGDLHGSDAADMWISGGIPATIEYAFDQPYKLQEVWIWNSNQLIESFVGFGAKDVVIEYSADGEIWTILEGVGPLAQGPGLPGYATNNIVSFGGVMAQQVRVTVNSVQGIAPQASLSEVRFYQIPVKAREPQPANGATVDGVDAALSWRSGREAGRHEVYLDMDTASTLVATVDENSYLATALELDSTYHWKIHEVNDAEIPTAHASDTWSFSTPASISVDDMESYEDAEFLEIWATWVDGFNDPANGSLVGNGAAGTPETGIVHGGSQSLPLHFGDGGALVSEATRTFDQSQDWTRSGIQSLVLYLKPGLDSTLGGVYVKINDTKIVREAAAGSLPPGWDAWTQWTIDLSTVAGAASVRSLTIGVEGAGASGVIYVDSIQLFKNAPTAFQPLSWFEAEAADVMGASWRVVDDPSASGGNRIGSEDGDGDDNDTAPGAAWVASYTFTVPADGVYGLSLRAQEAGSDSFWVRIVGATSQSHEDPDQPGTGWVRFNEIDAAGGWVWDQVHSNDHGNAVVSWTLPAGTLTLEIAKREDGTYLDAIALMH